MICNNCNAEVNSEFKYCPECAAALIKHVEENVRYGSIDCSCGQHFYFETRRKIVNCISCNKEYDVSNYPIKGGAY
jgi:Uri superfamily endonuclease